MEAYARQAKDKALQADAYELSRRAERRLCEMMPEQKAARLMAKRGRPPACRPDSALLGPPSLLSALSR